MIFDLNEIIEKNPNISFHDISHIDSFSSSFNF